ncbi:hypothetical protein PIROE2DRAFT_3246 [Piromyces sp. E2]|nr:hypothetical protein PIROE2DRAFT_3246 [Piromyces sp. E2]|eukprot:OUM69006.1 hypothetical protein PIROE2DRAFT_3246 [Piromyces sp. E2]
MKNKLCYKLVNSSKDENNKDSTNLICSIENCYYEYNDGIHNINCNDKKIEIPVNKILVTQ